VLRTVNDQLSLWDAILPAELLVLPGELARMRAAGIAADVVAAWHDHTERMTQAVYGRVTDDRLTAASAVFTSAVGQS